MLTLYVVSAFTGHGGSAGSPHVLCCFACQALTLFVASLLVQPQIGDFRNQDLEQQYLQRHNTRPRPRSIRLNKVPKLPSNGIILRKIPQVLTNLEYIPTYCVAVLSLRTVKGTIRTRFEIARCCRDLFLYWDTTGLRERERRGGES